MHHMTEILGIGFGYEGIFLFGLIFVVLVHVVACIWVMIPLLNEEGDESWIDPYRELSTMNLYITSFYFTITTFSTVGYGDISGQSVNERFFSVFIEIFGFVVFSFAMGNFINMLASNDIEKAKLQERINIVERIYN
jgi:heme/copper-type cytochrome/quinol oxidase subunit 4